MKTFEEIALDPVGTIYIDGYENELRYIILRGTAALCAYIGIGVNHPLANQDYNNIPIRVHGGLTYACEGKGDYLHKEYFWYGWDYAHCGDASFYDFKDKPSYKSDAKKWSIDDVKNEIWDATYQMKQLRNLAESIYMKAKGWR